MNDAPAEGRGQFTTMGIHNLHTSAFVSSSSSAPFSATAASFHTRHGVTSLVTRRVGLTSRRLSARRCRSVITCNDKPPDPATPSNADSGSGSDYSVPDGAKLPISEGDASEYLSQLNDARASAKPAAGDEVTILGQKLSTQPSSPPSNPTTASTSSTTSTTTNDGPTPVKYDYAMARRALWRLSWVVWWPQLILTLISCAILLFSVTFPSVNISAGASSGGVVLTVAATILSLVSVLHTYMYTRLSVRVGKQEESGNDNVINVGRFVSGLVLALVGLATATAGLHAVTGILLARLLTSGFGRQRVTGSVVLPNAGVSGYTGEGIAGIIQPVDILVVQASANVIAGFVLAAILSTWFVSRVKTWQRKALEKGQQQQQQQQQGV